jgi:hypothetical protein
MRCVLGSVTLLAKYNGTPERSRYRDMAVRHGQTSAPPCAVVLVSGDRPPATA